MRPSRARAWRVQMPPAPASRARHSRAMAPNLLRVPWPTAPRLAWLSTTASTKLPSMVRQLSWAGPWARSCTRLPAAPQRPCSAPSAPFCTARARAPEARKALAEARARGSLARPTVPLRSIIHRLRPLEPGATMFCTNWSIPCCWITAPRSLLFSSRQGEAITQTRRPGAAMRLERQNSRSGSERKASMTKAQEGSQGSSSQGMVFLSSARREGFRGSPWSLITAAMRLDRTRPSGPTTAMPSTNARPSGQMYQTRVSARSWASSQEPRCNTSSEVSARESHLASQNCSCHRLSRLLIWRWCWAMDSALTSPRSQKQPAPRGTAANRDTKRKKAQARQRRLSDIFALRRPRQAQGELGARGPAVHLVVRPVGVEQLAHRVQAQAHRLHPGLAVGEEGLEDAGLHIRRDAVAVVADDYLQPALVAAGDDPQAALLLALGGLHRVEQHVAQGLGKVGVEPPDHGQGRVQSDQELHPVLDVQVVAQKGQLGAHDLIQVQGLVVPPGVAVELGQQVSGVGGYLVHLGDYLVPSVTQGVGPGGHALGQGRVLVGHLFEQGVHHLGRGADDAQGAGQIVHEPSGQGAQLGQGYVLLKDPHLGLVFQPKGQTLDQGARTIGMLDPAEEGGLAALLQPGRGGIQQVLGSQAAQLVQVAVQQALRGGVEEGQPFGSQNRHRVQAHRSGQEETGMVVGHGQGQDPSVGRLLNPNHVNRPFYMARAK
eukprot:TRINITY_DN5242_c0_g1_i1.p1 TRINITY_DN5242_c0_g1~~TRINITY_DN5242_c0_g1_i1.p1  ORF type:complete len:717 (-),score=192.51 TRINITY_DN5242_c0_g1_i1:146-2296(-)